MASGSSSFNYMDGVNVKIAENYKPPKRIPMLMSYSQRLALNKLIQEPVLSYDLTMEKSIKNKMYEWKKARTAVIEQRKQRLNQITQHADKNWEATSKTTNNSNITDNNEVLENKDSKINDSAIDDSNKQDKNNRLMTAECRLGVDPYYQTSTGILIPKIVQNNSQQQHKILTPIPLTNYVNKPSGESHDINNFKFSNKNPFNYSEFESDTSSPFDNMELKTINDLEELAQVLKYDSDDNISTNKPTGVESQQPQKHYQQHSINTIGQSKHNSIYRNLENNIPTYGLNTIKKYPLNGYYYHQSHHNNQNIPTQNINETILKTTQTNPTPTSIRSVTEIMKSLQADLANTHFDTSKKHMLPTLGNKAVAGDVTSVPSSSTEMLNDPFKNLTADLQKMAVGISSMGFPLPRVARACQLLEGNQKKIVEHLLAMSELLDLGFPEQQVASALIKCGNDRDKALDLLIT